MIRPITCICALLAAGSGLFLYQTKHRTLMLDRQIGQTYDRITAARSKIGILQAEWALLSSPERLAQLSDKFLKLQPMTPTQFVTLADLDEHLPPPQAQVAQSGGTDEPAEPAEHAVNAAQAAATPSPAALPAPTAAPGQPEQRPAAAARRPDQSPARLASAHPPEPHPAEPHPSEHRREAEPRHAAAASAARHNLRRNEPAERHRLASAEHEPPAHELPAHELPAHRAAKPVAAVRPPPRRAIADAEPRPVRPAALHVPAPERAAPVYARTPGVSGSLLGGVHAVMAPPVPVAEVAGWPRR